MSRFSIKIGFLGPIIVEARNMRGAIGKVLDDPDSVAIFCNGLYRVTGHCTVEHIGCIVELPR